MSLEIEIKYLMLESALATFINLPDCAAVWIEQFYFSPEKIKQYLLPKLQAAGIDQLQDVSENCQNGRVRLTRTDSTTEYTLTVKAPRENIFSRLEIEISIDPNVFNELEKIADYGSLKKKRYSVPGQLYTHSGIKKITAEIDQYYEIAGEKIALTDDLKFVVVEVEVEVEQDLQLVRQGKHDFKFLSRSIELMSLPEDLQPYFKNTYLARKGLDLRKILEVCQQLPR